MATSLRFPKAGVTEARVLRRTPREFAFFIMNRCGEVAAYPIDINICVDQTSAGRSRSGYQAVFCFYGSSAGWETRSRKPESTPPRGAGGRDGPDPARLVE